VKLKRFLSLVILLTSLLPASVAYAQTKVTFELVAQSTFVVETPQPGARWLHSIFRGETYSVGARTKDGRWLFLSSLNGWVLAELGNVVGDISQLPSEGEEVNVTSASKINPLLIKGVPADLSARAKQIYQFGLSIGNNPRAFSKIGDCNSVSPFFLVPFESGEFRLGQYVYLQETLNNFAGSFGREGYTARVGFSTESIFDPLWSDPFACGSANPLECEYRLQRPSMALISLGTNGAWLSDEIYEAGLRSTLRFLIARGVLPILSTKAVVGFSSEREPFTQLWFRRRSVSPHLGANLFRSAALCRMAVA
jgi:hypothetical protein